MHGGPEVSGDWSSRKVRRFASIAMCMASCTLLFCALCTFAQQPQQHRPMDVPSPTQSSDEPTRTRLILKDGTYQLVFNYKVVGDVVRYHSAERDGEEEDVPLALVDHFVIEDELIRSVFEDEACARGFVGALRRTGDVHGTML